MATRPASRDEYQIAIVCALPIEYDAVALLVDEFWSENGDQYGRVEGDSNTYATGRIGAFNVVLVLLANTGKTSAAGIAANLRRTYTRLDLVLLTGICGVVPGSDAGAEIFLGDVVISTAIVQYDLGRLYADGFVTKDTLDDRLPRPNKDIRNLLATFKTDLVRDQLEQRTAQFLRDQLEQRTAQFLRDLQEKAYMKRRGAKYRHPGLIQDKLFQPHYTHRHHLPSARCVCRHFSGGSDPVCGESRHLYCDEVGCDDAHLVQRHRRRVPLQPEIEGQLSGVLSPSIIIGRFGSGDSVMKSGEERDAIARRHGLVAFEMEGAGLWDEVPCILVKAACDYADSHKNKQWQGFAAAAAAAAMRALLERVMRTSKALRPRRLCLLPREARIEWPAVR